jgi:hypothetical protein
MWQPVISIITGFLLPILVSGVGIAIVVFVIALARKGFKYLNKKWDLDISEKQMGIVDSVVEDAVRMAEELGRAGRMTSCEKENTALESIKEDLGDEVDVSDGWLRNKIKAAVSKIFHNS